MSTVRPPGLVHTRPPLQRGCKACTRCGKDFHFFRSERNCLNCGSMVCDDCSNYRGNLPQFGYPTGARCCDYCAHFLQVYRMDYSELSKLDIKALKGYLRSYNLSTQGLLEKEDLIRAVQSYKPIPEESEVYFRQHLPVLQQSSSTTFEDMMGWGQSEPSTPQRSWWSSSSSSKSSGWTWDIDKFFAKLLGEDGNPSTPPRQTQSQQSQPRPARAQRSPQPQPQPQQQPQQQQQQQPQPRTTAYPSNTSTSSSSRPSTSHQPPPQTQQSRPRQPQATPGMPTGSSSSITSTLTLEELMTSGTAPSALSIKSIKAILDHHCVTYVGVIEKADLVERLQKLIDNTRMEQEMIKAQEEGTSKAPTSSKSSSSRGGGGGTSDDDNLCKICCDAVLNCVMLNCNHMATCMDCGKLVMESTRTCPICREYVVRLLHVFRA
ncbi:hypothetical protein B0O80DRAFT_438066 [Mortierella sp. GBAus27b]|nr:hypothetical protein B0O80DRAFT_438066 [Mortierella sp. GBAus27b]